MSLWQNIKAKLGGGDEVAAPRRMPTLKPPAMSEPFVVAGPFQSSGAVGAVSRLTFESLQKLYFRTAHADVTSQLTSVDFDYRPRTPLFDFNGPGSVIMHAQPQNAMRMFEIIGADRLRHRRLIGYWSFEQAAAPPAWQAVCEKLHEIWVPSSYCAKALKNVAGTLPVRVVPHPVPAPSPSQKDRYDFGLPADAIIVYMTFSMDANLTRKNPWCAINAFKAAFGDDMRYRLVIKVRAANTQHPAFRALATGIAAMSNAKMITSVLSAADNWALMHCADIIICPSRAEGFGLVQAEAMGLGKALICTDYSGTSDFIDADSTAIIKHTLVPVVDPLGTYTDSQQKWAEPDVEHTAALLFMLANDADKRAALGATARAKAETFFDPARFRSLIQDAVKESL